MQSKYFDVANIKTRSDLYKKIRAFFDMQGVLEVETPLLTPFTVTDPHVNSITVSLHKKNWFLQTSPEYMMKQLLVLGAQDIYQICKAFREDEFAQFHHPEFSMLEWYRIDMDYHALMQDVVSLMRMIFDSLKVVYYTYADLFEEVLGINPLSATCEELRDIACLHLEDHAYIDFSAFTLSDWQQYLFSSLVEPVLSDIPCAMIYDYPVSHSSLAKPSKQDPRVSERFEMFLNGIECANGFSELTSFDDCYNRFKIDTRRREQLGLKEVSMDQPFLQAMKQGLPKCSGVALGLDRLLMLITQSEHINQVIPREFDFNYDETPRLKLATAL